MLAAPSGFPPASRRSVSLLLLACAGIAGVVACHRRGFADVVLPPFPSASVAAEAAAPPGVVWREDVDQTVQAGLGRFLQRVVVEPSLEDGAFVGWEIRDLLPPEAWSSVDLRPGDVVTSVNGLPLEREEQAFDAFQSLLEASELRVTYLRAGQTRELLFKIQPRGRAGAAPAAASAAKPAASATGPAK